MPKMGRAITKISNLLKSQGFEVTMLKIENGLSIRNPRSRSFDTGEIERTLDIAKQYNAKVRIYGSILIFKKTGHTGQVSTLNHNKFLKSRAREVR